MKDRADAAALRLGGVHTVACQERSEGPFFTVPVDWLEATNAH